MIRFFILLILPMLLPAIPQAQQTALLKKIRLGIHGGGNISRLATDTVKFPVYNVFLPDLGLNARLGLKEPFGLQAGFQLSGRGVNNESTSFRLRTTYLDLQLTGQFFIKELLLIEAGLQYALLLNQVSLRRVANADNINYVPITDYSSGMEYIAGIGVYVAKGIEVGARYSVPYEDMKYTNFQVNISVQFSSLKFSNKKVKFNRLEDALASQIPCQSLVLQRDNLTAIPPEVFTLTELEELVLDGNSISTVPPDIGKLKKLTRLSLQFNKIDSLPAELGQLENLDQLYLRYNNLRFLPDSICRLKNLTLLYIGENSLRALPDCLGDLESLLELDLTGSGVMLELPPSFSRLRKLEVLWIDPSMKYPLPYNLPNARLKIKMKNITDTQ